jgi:hypothetical protein
VHRSKGIDALGSSTMMRRRVFLLAAPAIGALFVACGETEDNPSTQADASVSSEAGPVSPEGGREASASVDSSASDASPDDAAKGDASAPDGSKDSGGDADAVDGDAGADADADAGGPLNFAALGVASASSEFGGYPASRINDGVTTTSWYAATGSCVSNPDGGADFVCTGTPTQIEVALDMARTVGRVKLFGNRDGYPTGYDVLTARLELLDATAAVVYTAELTTTRGAEPNGDVDHVLPAPQAGVKTVRVVLLTTEAGEPGLAELQAYED